VRAGSALGELSRSKDGRVTSGSTIDGGTKTNASRRRKLHRPAEIKEAETA
jgi:hypothetical protein